MNWMDADTIINTTAAHYQLNEALIKCSCRRREYIKAKHIAIYFLRNCTGLTLRSIGGIFGLGHADVLHAIKSVENQASVYPGYREELWLVGAEISEKLNDYSSVYNEYDTDQT